MDKSKKQTIRDVLVGVLSLAAGAGMATLGSLLYRMHLHYLGKTMFGRAFIGELPDKEGVPVRLLIIERSVQSGTYLGDRKYDPPFLYQQSFDCIFDLAETPEDVSSICVLGGGGYAWPKHAIAHFPKTRLLVIEVDPAITEIAHKHFFLSDLEQEFKTQETGRLEIIHDDALHFLDSSHEFFDAFISDCYCGVYAAASLESPEALAKIHNHLNPGGTFVANVICGSSLKRLHNLCELCQAEFAHVAFFDATDPHFSDEANYILIASDKTIELNQAVQFSEDENESPRVNP